MRRGRATPNVVHRKFSLILISVFIIGTAIVANSVRSASPIRVESGASGLGAGKTAPRLPVDRFTRPWLSAPLPPLPSVATFAGDCTTPKSVFNVQDTDKTVCAQVANAQPGWQVIWSNANLVAVQKSTLTAANQNVTFTLSTSSSLGTWRVILFEPIGGNVEAITPFTVVDTENPVADVGVTTVTVTPDVSPNAQVIFALQVGNNGPSPASNAVLTNDVPANTTFVSFAQLTGPVFTCNSPAAGATGTTTCTVATLNNGDTATFLATYQVNGGASTGSSISDTANISSDTFDNHNGALDAHGVPTPNNNTATATATVSTAPCVLSCPSNITQDADPGQAGAIVTYSTPSHTGDCGQDSIDPDTGITIPAISCTPISGSFFAAGTTTVICSSQSGGGVCTFQVTVNNPGGLSISLNGGTPLTIECGTQFSDPGATSVDGTGASVPVTVAYSQGFDPNSPKVGSYTATYTATEGANSTSTQRTINVTDTRAPKITINGSNPYKIEQGTCLPFVDPGTSADDECAGAETVSSSISGPGGLTHIDPNTPGTYTITYTSTDGTHSATATRTVLVGHFPPDEQDLGSSNGVPVIALLGGDPETHAVSAECGMFVDPGATATTACGNPLPYTVSGNFDPHTPGVYVLTYTVTDGSQSASVQRTVTITADNTAPTITLNGANPLTVECHTSFTDPGAVAHDACAGDFAATASGIVDVTTPGTYVITYNATDPSGHAATPVTRTVIVVDTTPPVINTNGQTISLWPPNHSYHTFAVTDFVTSVSDSCSSVSVSDVVITKVTSDEAENGSGSGNTLNDIVIAADQKSVQLRAEREGGGDGRVYTIYLTLTDSHGNSTTVAVTVVVPHNPGQTPLDSGVHYCQGACP